MTLPEGIKAVNVSRVILYTVHSILMDHMDIMDLMNGVDAGERWEHRGKSPYVI